MSAVSFLIGSTVAADAQEIAPAVSNASVGKDQQGVYQAGFRGANPSAEASGQAVIRRWLSELNQIERRIQPSRFYAGERSYSTLPAYYWAANQSLRRHLDAITSAYLDGDDDELSGLTLIAGTAGVGKTFIKSGLFGEQSEDFPVTKFDIRDWYLDFRESGLASYQADIVHGNQVMSQLLKLTDAGRVAFAERILQVSEEFLLIDSLDEVHPDDYLFLLQTVQKLVTERKGTVRHAFVFGRPLVFREYWHQCCSGDRIPGLSCFVLEPPALASSGDLVVSSWNYHCWKYKLRKVAESGEQGHMPLDLYESWHEDHFADHSEYADLVSESNQVMNREVQDTLHQWASHHTSVAAVMRNLAGNSMVREIVAESVQEQRDFDEKRFKEEFFAKWLERDTLSGDRPSRLKPRDLDLYVQLLESVALQYAEDAVISGNGYVEVKSGDQAVATQMGEQVKVPVEQLLNRSGLVNLDAQRPGDARYRFEPLWFHSWLIEKHRDRLNSASGSSQVVTAGAAK